MFNLVDLDGSLTGIPPSGPDYARILSYSPIYPSTCVKEDSLGFGPYPGVACQPGKHIENHL